MTVTYRSVILTILAVAIAFTAATFLLFPDWAVVKSAKAAFNGTIDKMFPPQSAGDLKGGQQQAHFTNIDGSVRVRKANSNAFVPANYDLPLDKGDVIKMGGASSFVLTIWPVSEFTARRS